MIILNANNKNRMWKQFLESLDWQKIRQTSKKMEEKPETMFAMAGIPIRRLSKKGDKK